MIDMKQQANKHVVAFSGGVGSALVALEVAARYGVNDLVLLNHDIDPRSEHVDIKRFKRDVANFIGVPITFSNRQGWEKSDQFDVVVEAGAFKVRNGTALCTSRMKTEPFVDWLSVQPKTPAIVVYYGFGQNEADRILRRSSIMAALGYRTAFPLAHWPRRYKGIADVGIRPPSVYATFKHANCTGCLKAGIQHWYVVYANHRAVFERALWAEQQIGYSIIKGHWLNELIPVFDALLLAGVEATEHTNNAEFAKHLKQVRANVAVPVNNIPCECTD
jgi:hypothetical protein